MESVTNYPVSPLQSETWRQIKSLNGTKFGYHFVSGLLDKPIDISRARELLAYVFQKNEVLRTSYSADQNGVVWGSSDNQVLFDLKDFEWGDRSDSTLARDKNEIIAELQNKDWTQPQCVMQVAKISANESWCLFALPALNSDLVNLLQILRWVTQASESENVDLDELTGGFGEAVQYNEVAAWLNDFLVDSELQEARAKWNKELVDNAFRSDFGLQSLSFTEQTANRKCVRVSLSHLSGAIAECSDRLKADKADFVCSSLRLALSKYYGAPLLSRVLSSRSEELSSAFGPLTRAVPLSPEESEEVEDAVVAECRTRKEFQEYIECFSKPPKYEGLGFPFTYSSIIDENVSFIEIEELRESIENAKLEFTYFSDAGGEGVLINYDESFIAESSIDLFLEEWCEFTLIQKPDERRAERSNIEISGAEVDLPAEKSNVLSWFSSLSSSHTQNFTIEDEITPEAIDYEKLNRKSNAVANYLIQHGMKKGDIVAIRLARGVNFIVTMLGVMKAGGVYMPVDVSLPSERAAFMLEESGAKFFFSVTQDDEFSINRNGLFVKDIVDLLREISDESELKVTIGHDDLAYLLYTSGTTGKPKGILIKHASLANHMHWMLNEFNFGTDDKFLHRTSVGFDASIWEVWAPLLCGGSLVIAPEEVNQDPKVLIDYLQKYQITVLQLVPSHLNVLTQAKHKALSALNLRNLFLGGEALSADLASVASSKLNCELVNVYGPSECCVQVIYQRFNKGRNEAYVPIGKPIDSVNCLVLRQDGELAKVGQEGELLISGPCVFSAYIAQPKMTEDALYKFDGSVYYRSGDLVRILTDGSLYFLGRRDDQIKVNGFRIELGEISKVAQDCEFLSQASCVYDTENKRITLFVKGENISEDAVLDYLKARLPQYMQPSFLMELDEFPKLSNGKLDRKALISLSEKYVSSQYRAPTTELESKLVDTWSDLLTSDQPIGVDSNFFMIGGDSLSAMRMTSRISEEFSVHVTLRALFENATISDLSKYIEASGNSEDVIPLERVATDGPQVLSFSQQRIWFVTQLDGLSSAYNVPSAFSLEGELDIDAIRAATQSILNRHQVLRSTIEVSEGEQRQLVQEVGQLPITFSELVDDPAHLKEQKISELINQEINYSFDFKRDILLRIHVIKVENQRHVVFFNMHHIAADGWSRSIFFNEFCELYNSHTRNRQPSLPDLPVQYADYAEWQKKCLSSERYTKNLADWKEYLSDLPEVHSLPLDYPRGPQQTHSGTTLTATLSGELLRKVDRFCNDSNFTTFMFLDAVFAVFLSRYSGEKDIVFGAPISGRSHVSTENLIGCFVNNLVFRCNVVAQDKFLDLLEKTKQMVLDAEDRQEIPFEVLVEELNPNRSLSFNPLFQIMLVIENEDADSLYLDGVKTEKLHLETVSTILDLILSVRRDQEELVLNWAYNTDLFSSETIKRMSANFLVLLEGIIEKPESRIGELPMLTLQEQRLLQEEWNDTSSLDQQDASVVSLFESQAEASPEAIAVSDERQSLSYQELNEASNRLCHYLKDAGVGRDTRIGLCLDRSVSMVVGMLGVMKAGGAYIPLDPQSPSARLSHMLEDAGAVMVLTQMSLASALPSSAQALYLDDAAVVKALSTHSADNVDRIESDFTACAIYTSGSTGEPKGVLLSHASIVNRLSWMQGAFAAQSDEVFVQKTGLNFVDHIAEIFQPLSQGTPLVILNDDQAKDIDLLVEAISRHRITRITLVPSLLRLLAEHIESQKLSSLRCVISSGEALSEALARKVQTQLPQAQLINLYGATEVSADVTYAVYDESGAGLETVSIGKPIANSEVYVLDGEQQLLPLGAKGELYVSGACLAQGYLNRDEEEKTRFVPHVYKDGERMYRTGDIVRWLPQGELHYLGREDHQIKLRGMRLEAGEVEEQLRNLPEIQGAAVSLCAVGQALDKRLVAYIVMQDRLAQAEQARQDQTKAWEEEVRKALKAKLPEYMVPELYIFLESLPLTVTGKVDRKALPVPQESDVSQNTYAAPRNDVEALLCQLWQDILQVDQVGIEDNFFELGGHSLLATRLMSAVRKALKVELPLKELFEHPTVAGLSESRASWKQQSLPPVVYQERDGQLLASYAQQRLWFIDRLDEAESTEYNLPLRFRFEGKFDTNAYRRALQEIVNRHEVLRTILEEVDGEVYQIIRSDVSVDVRETDLSALDDTEKMLAAQRLGDEEAKRPFDLQSDVLLRGHVYQLGAEDYGLLLTLHHIAADGWSLGLLFKELSTLYRAYSEGQASPLPPLKVQYADYAHWQRTWLQSQEGQLAYWKEQLQDLPELHSLPLDYARPPRQRFEGKTNVQAVDIDLIRQIHQHCQPKQATLFMFIQSAFSVLLSRYSHETDIVMGSPIAGRIHSDIEPLIGLFVNTLVLRSDVSGNPTFSDLLEKNRQTILHAYENQSIPFETLVEKLQPQRNLSHSPMFQIMLTYNNERPILELDGLHDEPAISSGTKYDLELTVIEYPDAVYLEWTYNTSLFASDTIERMSANFLVLLEGIIENPEIRIGELPMLATREQRLLKQEWNNTDVVDQENTSVVSLFESQVEVSPDAMAVSDEWVSLSYIELNLASNRLAHYLRSAGVSHNTLVGLCMDRSVDMVVGMLGVMKAGGAYVPLDPKYPSARLSYMLEDAGAALVLTQLSLVSALPSSVQTVCLDDQALVNELSTFSVDDHGHIDNEFTACAIYTSGSTGEPKGVLLSHKGIVNRLSWMRNVFVAEGDEVFIQKTGLNFVDHVAEIFQPLCQGTPLVIINEEQAKDIGLLAEAINRHRITRITLVPSLLRLIVENTQAEDLASLRCIISSGEALTEALARKVQMHLPQVQLINLYGATEVSADVTFHVCNFGNHAGVMQYFSEELSYQFNANSGQSSEFLAPLKISNNITTPDIPTNTIIDHFKSSKIPNDSQPISDYIGELNEYVFPHVVNVSSNKYVGHMTSSLPNFMAEFARLLTILNQNMVKIETSKSLTFIERQTVAMVHRQFFDYVEEYYDDNSQNVHAVFGLVTSGGTTSNITAMLCARNKALQSFGFTREEIIRKGAANILHSNGLGAGVIIGSRLAHYSIRKAAQVLGIGEENILLVDQDEDQKISISHLKSCLEKCKKENKLVIAIIGLGGATETGTIDPLERMAEIAQQYKVHFHVDAAWGGGFLFSNIYRKKLRGIEHADTVTFCAHKQLYLPQGISILLFGDPKKTGIIPTHATYQAQHGSYDMGQHTLEGSRPASALLLHAALHLFSRKGYGWLIDQSMEKAQSFVRLVKNCDAFELIGQPDMNIINYRYVPNALRGLRHVSFSESENEIISSATETIQQHQFLKGKTFVSKTKVINKYYSDRPISVFRVVLSNPQVTDDDLIDVLSDQISIASRLVESEAYNASISGNIASVLNIKKDEGRLVPIGKPINNTKIYLVDKNMQLVPLGAKGEVCIAGQGLASGYLNRPELNKDKFVTNPFSDSYDTIYKTGDTARWLGDGSLQFVDRIDHQVNIRGIRVEPGEVEAALTSIDGIEKAAVVCHEDNNREAHVVAYVVIEKKAGSKIESVERSEHANYIRHSLLKILPSFMVPEKFITLESMPLTINGKLDKSKLLLNEDINFEVKPYLPATNDVQRKLVTIWESLLDSEKVSITDNFFLTGGHSLLAITLVNRIANEFDIKITLSTVFERPDIQSLSSYIELLMDRKPHNKYVMEEKSEDDLEIIV